MEQYLSLKSGGVMTESQLQAHNKLVKEYLAEKKAINSIPVGTPINGAVLAKSSSLKATIDNNLAQAKERAKTVKVAPVTTPKPVAHSKNPAVNYWSKVVTAKEQEYKKSVASDKKSNPGLPLSNDTIDKGIQLQKAKESLQKEINSPMPNK